ncbi:MAG: hypothetical protein ACMUEM_04755 [Flavobacteriales bacterium AspAUS03]
MSPEEQRNFFQKHIDQLKKEDEEKQRRYTLGSSSKVPDFNNTFEDTKKIRFYFYNTIMCQTGINDFISICGNRSLLDN